MHRVATAANRRAGTRSHKRGLIRERAFGGRCQRACHAEHNQHDHASAGAAKVRHLDHAMQPLEPMHTVSCLACCRWPWPTLARNYTTNGRANVG